MKLTKTRLEVLSEFTGISKNLFYSRHVDPSFEDYDEFFTVDDLTGSYVYYNVLANDEERIARLQSLLNDTESSEELEARFGTTDESKLDVEPEELELYLTLLGKHENYWIYRSS